MKRTFVIVLMALLCLSHSSAQTMSNQTSKQQIISSDSMVEIFKTMPDSIIPYLSKNNRLDMIDFKASNMDAKVINLFDNHSVLDTITTNYLRISLSPISILEMELIAAPKHIEDSCKNIIKMTFSVGDSHKEKAIRKYTTNWYPLK